MAQENPILAGVQQAPANTEQPSQASGKDETEHPHLKVFAGDCGASEFELRKRSVTIGRGQEADIVLPNRSVSRVHAQILQDYHGFSVEDVGSTSGTFVNGARIERHVLHDGDSIEIGPYLLQFRTHRPSDDADEVAARAKFLLRGSYRTLPTCVRLRFRTCVDGSGSTGGGAATLQTEQGGLLIPTTTPPTDGSSLELELTMPGRDPKRVLGELVGAVEKGDTHWMCVRLQRVSKRQHEIIVAGITPGPWVQADTSDECSQDK